MKLFQMYRKLLPVCLGYNIKLQSYGFSVPNSIQKVFYCAAVVSGYILIAVGIFATVDSLIFTATTLQEYTDNAILFAALLNDALLFVSLNWRFERVLKLIESFEKLVEISK